MVEQAINHAKRYDDQYIVETIDPDRPFAPGLGKPSHQHIRQQNDDAQGTSSPSPSLKTWWVAVMIAVSVMLINDNLAYVFPLRFFMVCVSSCGMLHQLLYTFAVSVNSCGLAIGVYVFVSFLPPRNRQGVVGR
jgi:hypothetical protein